MSRQDGAECGLEPDPHAFSDPRYIPLLLRHAGRFRNPAMVDLGCGPGRVGFVLARAYEPCLLVGVDIWKPSLNCLRSRTTYDHLVLCDCSKLPFRNNSFDIAFACDVIEHMGKARGMDMLSEIERISKNVIITTPNISLEAGDRAFPYEDHKSRWFVRDFNRRGYKCHGVRLKVPPIYDVQERVRSKVWKRICEVSAFLLPRFGILIVAEKGPDLR